MRLNQKSLRAQQARSFLPNKRQRDSLELLHQDADKYLTLLMKLLQGTVTQLFVACTNG